MAKRTLKLDSTIWEVLSPKGTSPVTVQEWTVKKVEHTTYETRYTCVGISRNPDDDSDIEILYCEIDQSDLYDPSLFGYYTNLAVAIKENQAV